MIEIWVVTWDVGNITKRFVTADAATLRRFVQSLENDGIQYWIEN